MSMKDIKEEIIENKEIFLTVLVLTSILLISISIGKESMNDNPANVTIKDRQMLVNGEPFIIKGVGYSPVPIGDERKDYFTSPDIYNRDLPLLREMGANAIRVGIRNNDINYTHFLNKAYNNGEDPIYVIASFWINPDSNVSSQSVRNMLKSNFREMVAKHKDNPAILMWVIGNELDLHWKRENKDKLDDVFSLIDEMAKEAHLEEGSNRHPVTTVLVDWDSIDTIKIYDSKMTYLDLWSINIYRGKTFGDFFIKYQNVSSRPVAILEFGIDSYDDINHVEYESMQAEYAKSLWKEIETNSNITIGGSITSYSDQWWKGKYAMRSNKSDCPNYNVSFHSDCGYPLGSHPDRYVNEEWWGIMRVKDNGTGPDIMEPKDVYYTLMELWK